MERFPRCTARVFFLRAKNLRGSEQAHLFVEQLPKIRALAAQTARPFIAQVTKTQVELLSRPMKPKRVRATK